MSPFTLINSLVNQSVDVVTEETQPQPAQEFASIDDADRISGYQNDHFKYSLNMTYSHPSLAEPIYLTVQALLGATYSVEDNSFDFNYGSERGVHKDIAEVFDDLEWTNVTVPHIADNMELFKLEPEKVRHVTKFVVDYLTSMNSDAISEHVDIDKLIELARPEESFPEPDEDY